MDTCELSDVTIRIEAKAVVTWHDCQTEETKETVFDLTEKLAPKVITLYCPYLTDEGVACYWLRNKHINATSPARSPCTTSSKSPLDICGASCNGSGGRCSMTNPGPCPVSNG